MCHFMQYEILYAIGYDTANNSMFCLKSLLSLYFEACKLRFSVWLVSLTYEDKQDPHDDLQDEGDADEADERNVEGERGSQLQDGLQLGGVGHQQRDIQHALCCTFLIGIMVHVNWGVP